jgi:hypothetical protein
MSEVIFVIAFVSIVYFTREALRRWPDCRSEFERLSEQRRRRKAARR